MSGIEKRDVSIDILKAIGIICMVGGHCEWPIKHFVYLFHMALFFIASGYLFKPSNSSEYSSVVRFIKRKFVTLWVPYFFGQCYIRCYTIFLYGLMFILIIHY